MNNQPQIKCVFYAICTYYSSNDTQCQTYKSKCPIQATIYNIAKVTTK